MHIDASRALLLAALLGLSNAPAFANGGKAVGTAVARTIACNQSLAYQLELENRILRRPGTPPRKTPILEPLSARIRRQPLADTRSPTGSA